MTDPDVEESGRAASTGRLVAEPGRRLPDAELDRVAFLPLKPAPVTLVGPAVTLRPLLLPDDAEALQPLTDGSPIDLADVHVDAYDPDARVWRFLFGGPFDATAGLAEYLRAQAEAPDRRTFAVHHRQWDRVVGVYNLASNSPANLRIELGGICLSPAVQGRGVLIESTYLCLRHAFGLGYHRVEWKGDDRNVRSKRAALRLGFTAEGVQQQHMIVKGRTRDTAWFRMLREEWPGVRASRYATFPD